MYKIYINEIPLLLMHKKDSINLFADMRNVVVEYRGKSKILSNYIDMLEKSNRFDQVVLYADDYEGLVCDFLKLYKLIEAAGGVVFNEKEEVLFIFRRDFWDLPKGKIDAGESKEQAALREVKEETGLNEVQLLNFLCETYHTYRLKDKRILKRTYWYRMKTTDKQLVPQKEEDIEQAIWEKIDLFLAEKNIVYKNILEVLLNL